MNHQRVRSDLRRWTLPVGHLASSCSTVVTIRVMPTRQHEAPGDDDLVSGQVAARIAGVHPNTLYRWVRDNLVPHYRTPGGRLQIKAGDVRPEKIIQLVEPRKTIAQTAREAS